MRAAAAVGVVLALAVALALAPGAGGGTGPVPRTWYLGSPLQLRLPPPPPARSATTRAELRRLLALQSARTAQIRSVVDRWNEVPAVVPWTQLALQMIVKYRPRPAVAARALALLETGMYDALVAADASRDAYQDARPAPVALEPRLKPLLRFEVRSSYAPARVAMAGAAERILAHLFPAERAATFTRAASEATRSRLWGGLNYESDVTRARRLGWQVGALVVARAKSDGFANTALSGERPGAEGYWEPTPPLYEPLIGGTVGTWRPWLMRSPSQLRRVLAPPSAYGSPAFLAQVQKVLQTRETLTETQKAIAYFWADGPGTVTPPGHWFEIAIDLLSNFRPNEQRAAEAFSLLGAAEADAAIAFFEAKYHWWSVRPVTAIWRLCDGGARLCTDAELEADPTRATYRERWFPLLVTPPFPSYPAGHPTFSGAAARVLGYFFPPAAKTLAKFSEEAARSRLYGGIHFEEDNQAGLRLGRAIGDIAIAWARTRGPTHKVG